MKVFAILPNLLLQKPSMSSQVKDHIRALEERLEKRQTGELRPLLRECKAIQRKLKSGGKKRTEADISRIVSNLVYEGKIGAALRFLDENADNCVLAPNPAVIEKLKELHPSPAPVTAEALLRGPLVEHSPENFNCIDEQQILKAAKQVKGAGGPSLFDAKQWRRVLTSKHFKTEGKELREELATFAKKISTEILDPSSLECYAACRLIPLDKNPENILAELQIRPIGIGEVLRRIVGKSIAWALSEDIQKAGGALQVSTGLKGGAEAAIHSMKEIFEMESTEAVILVDAANAFNTLNRHVALHNMHYLCPSFAIVLVNIYRQPARLFIAGGGEIFSMEGTTQGCSLAMQFYGISTKPLIIKLEYQVTNIHQAWLADDATGAGRITDLRIWWDIVQTEGKKFGYVVKPEKSWLILKNPGDLQRTEELFRDSEIKITTAGKRHLGAVIGSPEYKQTYIEGKVEEWCMRLKKLSHIARAHPQAAYIAYIQGEQHRYTYFLRTISNIAHIMKPLDEIIDNEFIPALFGNNISESDRELLALPIKEGGMGLRVISELADPSYEASTKITFPLKNQILVQSMDLPENEEVKKARGDTVATLREQARIKNEALMESQPTATKRNFEQLSQPGASTWLGALPLKDQGFNLNKAEFQDALNLRYDRPLKNLPSKCGCDRPFNVTHAMNCNKGGFISARHDNVRNFEAQLLKQVCQDVQVEPPLQPVSGVTFHRSAITTDEARLDVRARGFWRNGQNAFFDIRTTNADNASQRNLPLSSILRNHEQEKKRAYNARVMEIEQGTFTPIVLTVKGVMAPEATRYHKVLAEKISVKTGEKYEDVTRLIRIKLSFLVLKAALLCLRGSRTVFSQNAASCTDFAFSLNELGL